MSVLIANCKLSSETVQSESSRRIFDAPCESILLFKHRFAERRSSLMLSRYYFVDDDNDEHYSFILCWGDIIYCWALEDHFRGRRFNSESR